MKSLPGKPHGIRWGVTREIDYRTRVGTPAWYAAHPPRVRKLSAWRFLHLVAPGHRRVSKAGHNLGYAPSSNMPLKRGMLKVAKSWGAV